MRKEDFIRLLDRYLDGTADPGERLLVEEYYDRAFQVKYNYNSHCPCGNHH
ncbi:MAG: hypothetical protein P4L51_01170 [Puia sp.]|nr:hypothetical protein [Puia sp.]